MDFFTFIKTYNTEQKCVILWKEFRDKHGVYCNRCGSSDQLWLPSRLRYRCKQCNAETTLRSGTLLEYSKLPFHYWVYAIAVLSFQKKSISAIQVQRHLGHRHYRPIWLMMQKMKVMMADLVDWYAMLDHLIAGTTEFPAVPEIAEKTFGPENSLPTKRSYVRNEEGQKLEPMPVELRGLNLRIPEHHPWFKLAQGGRLRLISMHPESLKDRPFNHHHPVSRKTTPRSLDVLPDGMNIRIRSIDKRPRPWFKDDTDSGKLQFVEIMKVNAKRNLDGIHHYVCSKYMRNYLGEQCYLTNRRYSGLQKIEQMFALFVSKAWNLPYIVEASD
jgi:transposase-like protein